MSATGNADTELLRQELDLNNNASFKNLKCGVDNKPGGRLRLERIILLNTTLYTKPYSPSTVTTLN
jgi:hypothetical protein